MPVAIAGQGPAKKAGLQKSSIALFIAGAFLTAYGW